VAKLFEAEFGFGPDIEERPNPWDPYVFTSIQEGIRFVRSASRPR
jgi:hypothetical protein